MRDRELLMGPRNGVRGDGADGRAGRREEPETARSAVREPDEAIADGGRNLPLEFGTSIRHLRLATGGAEKEGVE